MGNADTTTKTGRAALVKIQPMQGLFDEMRAVARGETPAPPDAAEPSAESASALSPTTEDKRL